MLQAYNVIVPFKQKKSIQQEAHSRRTAAEPMEIALIPE